MKWLVIILLSIFSANFLVLSVCSRNIAPTPQPQTQEPKLPGTKKPAEYFHLTRGSYWQYQGKGMNLLHLVESFSSLKVIGLKLKRMMEVRSAQQFSKQRTVGSYAFFSRVKPMVKLTFLIKNLTRDVYFKSTF